MALILWHRLGPDGRITASVRAEDIRTAEARLGGPIVSDISYRLDRRWTPPAIVTEDGRPAKPPRVRSLPTTYRTTAEVADFLGINQQRVRAYAKFLRLVPRMVEGHNKARLRYYWSPEQIRQMRTHHDAYPERGQHPIHVARRLRSYLVTIHARYARRAAARRANAERTA